MAGFRVQCPVERPCLQREGSGGIGVAPTHGRKVAGELSCGGRWALDRAHGILRPKVGVSNWCKSNIWSPSTRCTRKRFPHRARQNLCWGLHHCCFGTSTKYISHAAGDSHSPKTMVFKEKSRARLSALFARRQNRRRKELKWKLQLLWCLFLCCWTLRKAESISPSPGSIRPAVLLDPSFTTRP